jgi:hypothetical protein
VPARAGVVMVPRYTIGNSILTIGQLRAALAELPDPSFRPTRVADPAPLAVHQVIDYVDYPVRS